MCEREETRKICLFKFLCGSHSLCLAQQTLVWYMFAFHVHINCLLPLWCPLLLPPTSSLALAEQWYYSRWGFWPFWWVTQFCFCFCFCFFLVSPTNTCYSPSVGFSLQFILRPTRRTQQYREEFLIPPCISWSMLLSGPTSPLAWIHWPLPMHSDGRDENFSTEKLSWWFRW